MSSSAFQAKTLRNCLAATTSDELSKRFFRASAKQLRPIWLANRLNDFAVSPVTGWRSFPQRALNWQTDKVMAAAANDIRLAEAFVRILQLIEPTTTLFRPSMPMRVIKGNRGH
jgi:hypothetical protein